MDIAQIKAELTGLKADLRTDLLKDVGDGYVTKSFAQSMQASIDKLQAELATKSLAATPHPKLINEAMAAEAAQWLVDTNIRPLLNRKPDLMGNMHKSMKDLLTKTPQDISQWVNSAGGYTVQTTIYPILEQLFLQSGGVRKFFNMTQMQGKIQVSSATDQACATFQGALASLAPTDTATISQTTLPLTASTLAPAPLTAIYFLSRQLMFNTATNLVSRIFENLAQANTLAEDVTALWGDGTTTYANNYGLAHVGANYVTAITTNTAGKTIVPLSIAAPATGEGLPTIDDLIAMTTQVQEEAALGEECGFFMNRQVAAYFRALKANSSGLYFLDPVVNPINTQLGRPAFMLLGYPVYLWNRMSTGQATTGTVDLTTDSSGAPHYTTGAIANGTVVPIVAFGSFKKAALIGTNRNYAIESSLDYRFGSDEIAYRGAEDWGSSWINYANPALATLNVTGAAS